MHDICRHYNNLLSSYLNGIKRVEGDHINIFIGIYHSQNYSTIFSWYLLSELYRDLMKNFMLVNTNLTINVTVHENKTTITIWHTIKISHVLVRVTWKDQVIAIFSYIEVNVCSNSPEEYTASIFRVTKSDSVAVKTDAIHSFKWWENHYCTVWKKNITEQQCENLEHIYVWFTFNEIKEK